MSDEFRTVLNETPDGNPDEAPDPVVEKVKQCQAIAQQLRDSVNLLNRQIDGAVDAGLTVDIDVRSYHVIGRPLPIRHISLNTSVVV